MKKKKFTIIILVALLQLFFLSEILFVEAAPEPSIFTLTDVGGAVSIVNTWTEGGNTVGYNITFMADHMVSDRLYSYYSNAWLYDCDQASPPERGGIPYFQHTVNGSNPSSYDADPVWEALESSDMRISITSGLIQETAKNWIKYRANITAYAGSPIIWYTIDYEFVVRLDLTVEFVYTNEQGTDQTVGGDNTDENAWTNSSSGGQALVYPADNYDQTTAGNGQPPRINLVSNLGDHVEEAGYTYAYYMALIVHNETTVAGANAVSDEYDDELCDAYATISGTVGASYDRRNDMTGAFDLTHASGNDISFNYTPVTDGNGANFTAFHIDSWSNSNYDIKLNSTLKTEDTDYFAYYNATSGHLDIVWNGTIVEGEATFQVKDAFSSSWTGKIMGVTNPAKIMGVAVANITTVNGARALSEHELGVFHYWSSDYEVPLEANWVSAAITTYVAPRENINVVLNYYNVHTPSSFETEAELATVETLLEAIPAENFWGIQFIREEHYKDMINFDDGVDTTWFGETLQGHDIYGGDEDAWKDEMYFRMIRGFYNYFSPLTNVGIGAAGPALYHPTYQEDSYLYYFGQPAMDFIVANYDYMITARYSTNLADYKERCEPMLVQLDRFFSGFTKIAVITRQFSHNIATWEPEAIGIEMKNFLDRDCIVMTYEENAAGGYPGAYGQDEMWAYLVLGRELYHEKKPYCESIVDDTNLLTDEVGDTYGWVLDPANDEDLYP